jgi:hypothetical protein
VRWVCRIVQDSWSSLRFRHLLESVLSISCLHTGGQACSWRKVKSTSKRAYLQYDFGIKVEEAFDHPHWSYAIRTRAWGWASCDGYKHTEFRSAFWLNEREKIGGRVAPTIRYLSFVHESFREREQCALAQGAGGKHLLIHASNKFCPCWAGLMSPRHMARP